MPSPPDVIAVVSQQLDDFFTARRTDAAPLGPEAAALIASAAGAVDGGKRLRARFCVAGWEAAGASTPTSAVQRAAAALEIFHAAALVHDDIIDRSDTRRGRPSAHRAWEQSHRQDGRRGDAEAFGAAAAILVGDLLLAYSDDLFEQGLEHCAAIDAAAARAQYARMRTEVTIGQFLDVTEESAPLGEPDADDAVRALRVASLKSARYSVQQPLLIGACLAGAGEPVRRALSAFGHPIGMAFQLRDDMLGVFGDERVTGKPSGDDLREGKRTVLVAYAREAMDAADRRVLDETLGDPTVQADRIARVQRMIGASGAGDRVEALIADFVRDAEAALDEAPISPSGRDDLRQLGRAATVRTA